MSKAGRQKKSQVLESGERLPQVPMVSESTAVAKVDAASLARGQRRKLPMGTQLEREELLSVRLMPVLHCSVSFAPSQSGLGLNDGFISIAPKNLLGLIRSIAAGAAPMSTEMEMNFVPDIVASDTGPEQDSSNLPHQLQQRARVPFEVWLPASSRPMRIAMFLLAVRFLLGIQIHAWIHKAASPERSAVPEGTLARVIAEVMGTGASETLEDLGWTALAMIMLLTIQELATFESGLQDGFSAKAGPFTLSQPVRMTRGFRTNTSQHRIERLQLKAREQLAVALAGLGHRDQAALVEDASANLVYGPTILTAGWVVCAMLLVCSTASVWPQDESLVVCAHTLDNSGFMGFGDDVCTFERATAWAASAGQILTRVCLFLAVRIDEVKALCNRAGAVQCLAIVEDIDDNLALQKQGDPAATFTIREVMRLKNDAFASKEAIQELHTAVLCLLGWLASSTVWFVYRPATTPGGVWSAALLQIVLASLVATVLTVLDDVAKSLSALPELVVKEFPPSANKEALVAYMYPNPRDWSVVANQPNLPSRKSTSGSTLLDART